MKVHSQKDHKRKSISHFTSSTPLPTSVTRCDKKSRRSTSSLGSENSDRSPTNILFEMVMSDPKKKALVERLLYEDRDKIEEYKKKEHRKNVAKNNRLKKLQRILHCESPTALLRRRALEQDKLSNKSNSTSGSDSSTSSPLLRARPFEKLLSGVIAYVEINSHGKDCSAGAKALMQTMGATIKDQFGPNITHVIFKDGSYNTFKTAKLLKMHVVSVLWLEAVRKSKIRVPEKNYPALGAEYNDISQICQDYESVINEEYRRSLQTLTQNKSNLTSRKTAIPSELEPIKENVYVNTPEAANSNVRTKRRLTEIIPSSQGWECESIISYESGHLPFRKVVSTINEDSDSASVTGSFRSYSTSDNDSDCGIINGHSTKRSSQPSQLDISLGILQNQHTSANIMANTPSGQSTSLLARKSVRLKKSLTCIETVDMELTENLDDSNNKENILNSKQKNRRGKTPKKPLHSGSVQKTPVKFPSNINPDEKLLQEPYVNLSKDSSVDKTPTLSIPSENPTIESSISRRSTRKSQLNKVSPNLSSISTRKRTIRSSKVENQLTENERFSLRISSDASEANTETKKSSINSELVFSLRVSSDTSANGKRKSSSKSCNGSLLTEDTSTNTSKNSRRKTNSKSGDVENLKSQNLTNSEERFSLRVSSDDASEGSQQPMDAPSMPPENVIIEESQEKPAENDSQLNINCENTSTQISNVSTHSARNISPSRSKDDSCIPTKKPKVYNENLTKSERKPRKLRKLYNVDQSYDEEVFKNWNPNTVNVPSQLTQQPIKPTTVMKINEVIKKAVVIPLTPIQITPLVKKLYDKTKNESIVKKQEKSKKKQKETAKVATTKKAQLNSSKDEQRELIDEYVNQKNREENKEEDKDKQPFKKPTSRRLFSPQKPLNHKESIGDKIISRINRRSTLDFAETPQVKMRKRLVHKIKNPSIVCTRLHRAEVENFIQIVKQLGYFFGEDEVTHKTTHLVVGETKRTINLLRGIARGCWIITKEWLFRSLEASKWLPEEDFELTDFSPAVQQCRMQRQAFGPLYSMDIFADCGPIYVGYNSIPRRSDLQELIELCKGVTTNTSYNASVVVGDWVRYEGVTCVTEKWVLDSITFNKRKSFKNYIITQSN